MSLKKVIYYPDFEPSKFWFRSHLLFYDRIHSIIPDEYKEYKQAAYISEIVNVIPGSFKKMDPTNSDKSLDNVNLELLRNSFKIIKENPEKYPPNYEISIKKKFGVYGGATLFHHGKMSEQILELMNDFNFIYIDTNEIQKNGINLRGFSVVNKYAADLIVSHIADNMGQRSHINTITQNPLDFSLNSLNNLPIIRSSDVKTTLATSIITGIIPQNIEGLSAEQYHEIREQYKDVRKAFHETSINLSNLNDLGEFDNFNAFQKEITDISNVYVNEVNILKKSLLDYKIKQFIPVLLGGVGVISGGIVGWPIGTGVELASVMITPYIVDGMNNRETESKKIQRRIASLQNDIEIQENIRGLLKSGWY